MRIDRVNIYQVLLPFKADFSHSRRKGASAKNIIVEVVADQRGIKGFGEGAPRTFVTGERPESSANSIKLLIERNSFPWDLNNISQIWDFVDSLPKGKGYNSGICALEMSLLDALGKREDKTIIEYFPQNYFSSTIYYGATIPLVNKQRIMDICKLIKDLKIHNIRLKMGKDLQKNREMVETVNSIFGEERHLRIDVNGAWDLECAVSHIPIIEKYEIKVVEQPLRPDDPGIAAFAKLIQNQDIILMADESACSFGDLEQIIEEGHYKMINVRLSKCGGFRRSLRIVEHLRTSSLNFEIGSHLGESGILSAASRALGLLCKDSLYYDGSVDKFLLMENITYKHVSFGRRGKAGPLEGPGLGIEVNIQNLERLSAGSNKITTMRP